jgi:tetratricopeptide (TPR) repeat protein
MIAVALIDAIYRTGARAAARDEALVAQGRWPDEPEVWLISGKVWRGMGKHDLAREAFERAIRLDPKHERAWLGLASAWIALGKPPEAEDTYRRLLREVPDSVEGRFLLAERMLERDADGDAEPQLRKVLELDPDHIDARLYLARSMRKRGRVDEAVLETRQAFDRTGGDLTVAEELFWLLCEAGDRQGALDLLGLLDDPSLGLGAHLAIAHLYRQLGALAEAVAVADAALAAEPTSAAARLGAAQARADRGQGEDRADAIALALEIPIEDDNGPTARALAAELLVAAGDVERAAEVIADARSRRPDSIDLLSADAELHHARRDTAGGRGLLEKAVKKRPGSIALRFALASYEDHVGELARAVKHAEAIVAARDDHVGALNLAGYALAKEGKHLDRAEAHLTRARELSPGDPAILDSWGWLLYRQGKLPEAERALAQAAHLAPHQAEIQGHLDEVRARIGKR